MLFIYYPACSTCKKAKKWLDTHNIQYTGRHIKEYPPSAEEIKTCHRISGIPIKKFFNTSGQRYRELHLKDKLSSMSDAACYELLASDGMLVKRPLVITDSAILIGFKEIEWGKTLLS